LEISTLTIPHTSKKYDESQTKYCGEVSHKERVAENNDDQKSLDDDSSQVIEHIEINKIKNLPL
jgi:hypothetical protein